MSTIPDSAKELRIAQYMATVELIMVTPYGSRAVQTMTSSDRTQEILSYALNTLEPK
jgi:hypothetical protein